MVYSNIKEHHAYIKNYINKQKNCKKQELNTKSTITFLIKCRNMGIVPNFIINSTKNVRSIFECNQTIPTNIDSALHNILSNFHSKLLSLLIRQKHEIVKGISKKLAELEIKINEHLTIDEQEQFWKSERILTDTNNRLIKSKHKKKFKELKEQQREKLDIIYNKNWFVNKTSTIIPEEVQWLLSLGEKFAIPTEKKKFPLFKMIADGEDCIQTLENKEEQEIARTRLTSILENHINKHKLSERDRYILSTVEQTKRFLHKNSNILIVKADKGNATVAMEKAEYETRMKTLLDDMMTYRRILKDPTTSLQRKNNELVDELFRIDNINIFDRKKMKNDTTTAPRLYGLPKIHKEEYPLRPICASVNSPSSELCKLLTNVLKKLTEFSVYNIRDAVQFRNKINNSAISDDEKLVSFDVISLFPSIPVDFAIEVINNKWDDIRNHTNIPRELFLKILKFCIKDNRYFKYKDKFYKQCRGLPMGSPASPIVADIVMEELLRKCMEELDEKPRLLTKYVDDLFGIVKINAISKILQQFNSFHPNIKFTMEEEVNKKLPYLDTLVVRNKNIIKIDWYQKPTSSGRITNFYSNQPKNVILNTANNLIKRVLAISDDVYHMKNIRRIKNILKNNNFPDNIIKKLINESKNKKPVEQRDTDKMYRTMTYVPKVTERMKNASLYDKGKFKIAHTTDNTLKRLFSNTKCKIDKMDKNNVIYKIGCKGSDGAICDQVYIGTTGNKLKTRIAGHKSDIKNISKISTQKTALASHCAEKNHKPKLENVEIIQRESKYNKRYTLEMLHIINTPKEKRMNFKTDTENCANNYRHIINKKLN